MVTAVWPRAHGVLEILLGVIPGLYEAVPEAECCRLVGLLIIKIVATPRQRVLHMVDNGLLDAQHIVLDVGVCNIAARSQAFVVQFTRVPVA